MALQAIILFPMLILLKRELPLFSFKGLMHTVENLKKHTKLQAMISQMVIMRQMHRLLWLIAQKMTP